MAAARCSFKGHFVPPTGSSATAPGPEGETGESHEPETHLIPNAIAAALGRTPVLEIFGDDYPTPDGTCIRDYVHVSDVAEAHVRALSRLAASAVPVTCDLGTGKGASVREIVATVEAVTGRPVPVRKAPRRPATRRCSIRLAKPRGGSWIGGPSGPH
jgi:UDP-glucose 4-epimerase